MFCLVPEEKTKLNNYAKTNYGEALERLSEVIASDIDEKIRDFASEYFLKYFYEDQYRDAIYKSLDDGLRERIRQNFLSGMENFDKNYDSAFCLASISLVDKGSIGINVGYLVKQICCDNTSRIMKDSCLHSLIMIYDKYPGLGNSTTKLLKELLFALIKLGMKEINLRKTGSLKFLAAKALSKDVELIKKLSDYDYKVFRSSIGVFEDLDNGPMLIRHILRFTSVLKRISRKLYDKHNKEVTDLNKLLQLT